MRGAPRALPTGHRTTPSHNPPRDGGFKYNPPHGGPAEAAGTRQIQSLANACLESGNRSVRLVSLRTALASPLVEEYDFIRQYVDDLALVLDMKAIAASGLKLGADPLGGASLPLWEPIAETYGLEHCGGQQGGGPHLSLCALR